MIDETVKSQKSPYSVIPAKARNQKNQTHLASRLCGSDDFRAFYDLIMISILSLELLQ
ncbi:hypothetical protein KKA14_11120 [bacterium]|nr:hypothetical protein [bacterium]